MLKLGAGQSMAAVGSGQVKDYRRNDKSTDDGHDDGQDKNTSALSVHVGKSMGVWRASCGRTEWLPRYVPPQTGARRHRTAEGGSGEIGSAADCRQSSASGDGMAGRQWMRWQGGNG